MNVFDFVNDISYKKENIFHGNEDIYNAFIVNRAFSLYRDTLFIANEANKLSNLDKDMQFGYLFNKVPKKRRWEKWPKKEKLDNLAYIQEYYKYSVDKARHTLSILTDDQLAIIKNNLKQGGVKKSEFS